MNWWIRLWHRKQMDEQLEKELNFHIEEHTSNLIARGYDADEARRRARLDLGGPEQVKEECRDQRGTRWFDDLLQDFRYALRTLQESWFCVGRVAYSRGIGSVAIGFAFQNILQNFLAGVLLLVNEPFRLGDLISVTGIEGNVDDIQARATVVTTKEGRQVVIPNAVLFTNPVAVAHNGTTHQ